MYILLTANYSFCGTIFLIPISETIDCCFLPPQIDLPVCKFERFPCRLSVIEKHVELKLESGSLRSKCPLNHQSVSNQMKVTTVGIILSKRIVQLS